MSDSQLDKQIKRITKLSPLLINQIAAGEVVTRPASVVKELIENAIDAGATQISVHIEQGGLGLIQVSDNGRGIYSDDMLLAVTRHATSKLADVSELTGIDSLGFRGEALASIAAVAHLTLTSSHDDSGIGRQLVLSGNDSSQAVITPVVKSQGTTVCVRDLYFNIPARRNNLKSIATEFAHIEQVIQKIAISFAHIQLDLYHQNKQRFSLSNSDIKPSLSRLEQALGVSLQLNAQPFCLSLQALQSGEEVQKPANIHGWIFLPTTHNQTLPKLIYINQRLVTDLSISQTLAKAARQADIESMGYALFFDLPVTWININIHPSKQQVKIQPLTNMLALLNQALLEQLKPAQLKQQPTQFELVSTTTSQLVAQQGTDLKSSPPVTTGNYPSFAKLKAMGQANQVLAQQFLDNTNRSEVRAVQQVYELTSDERIEGKGTPMVLTHYQYEQQAWALVSWQQRFYLINPEYLLDLPKNNRQIDKIISCAVAQLTYTDLIQWMLGCVLHSKQ